MRLRCFFLLMALLLVGCSQGQTATRTGTPSPAQLAAAATLTVSSQPTGSAPAPASTDTPGGKPSPVITMIRPPDAEVTARVFLMAWQNEDYKTMHSMLTSASQAAVALDAFTKRYEDTANALTLNKLDFAVTNKQTNPETAEVDLQVTFHTNLLGDFERPINLPLQLEQGDWRVQWDDGLVLPELKGGNTLKLNVSGDARGDIYDRYGDPIASEGDVFALGIIKTDMDSDQEASLLRVMARVTGLPAEWIKGMYDNDITYNGDYVPVAEVPKQIVLNNYDALSSLAGIGVRLNPYPGPARYYPSGGIAPHVTGYVQAVPAEQLNQLLREGFLLNDRVGQSGLEQWGEKYLVGKRAATLNLLNPQGGVIEQLKKVAGAPAQSITTTLDSNLQIEAQKAMAGFNGAIVVLERDTGRVLAMVSTPGFDPNAFEYTNPNSRYEVGDISSGTLVDRAAGRGYPLGSVFKIITMSAALESGLFNTTQTLDCQYDYTEIPGVTLTDWTKAKGYKPSGILNLPEGLMRSCNPWFYHIGYTLYTQGHENDISNMARAFGLGSKTGIEGVAEEPGNIPDPTEPLDAAHIAIGQGTVLVNPLQVARFVAAVGNGGTLYQPQVIEKIATADGKVTQSFTPIKQGTLPVKPENLKVIQQAMRRVVSDPRGTAVQVFRGFNFPIYGKTGTAQSDLDQPHAWFAAYSDANIEGLPDIAVAVVAEYGGEGSEIAAPIARRVLETYFLGRPRKTYPWESYIYVTSTPTPLVTPTPAP